MNISTVTPDRGNISIAITPQFTLAKFRKEHSGNERGIWVLQASGTNLYNPGIHNIRTQYERHGQILISSFYFGDKEWRCFPNHDFLAAEARGHGLETYLYKSPLSLFEIKQCFFQMQLIINRLKAWLGPRAENESEWDALSGNAWKVNSLEYGLFLSDILTDFCGAFGFDLLKLLCFYIKTKSGEHISSHDEDFYLHSRTPSQAWSTMFKQTDTMHNQYIRNHLGNGRSYTPAKIHRELHSTILSCMDIFVDLDPMTLPDFKSQCTTEMNALAWAFAEFYLAVLHLFACNRCYHDYNVPEKLPTIDVTTVLRSR